jgi:chain length determinant protein EpsF
MGTQVDIINSKRVAQRVVRMLELEENPGAKTRWMEATRGQGTLEGWLSDVLRRNLEVRPSRESNVIDVSYSASDPAYAASVANAFVKAYLDTSTELRAQAARQYAELFAQRGKSLRDEVEKAQARLSEYQQRHGIVTSDERLDYETARLNELSAQLTVIQALASDARSKARAGSLSETLPEVVQNPVIVGLKSQIALLEGRLADLGGELGTNHPRYQSQQSELARLKQKLNAETRQLVSGYAALSTVGRDRESELRSAIEAQKRKLLQFKRQRGELAVLIRDVDAAQKAYDAVAQRFNQSNLESQSTQSNIAVLAPATEPVEPSSPNVLMSILVAIFLGPLLGVGAAFLLEMRDRRIRSAADLSDMLQLSVVGVIPRTRLSRRERARRLRGQREPALLPAR